MATISKTPQVGLGGGNLPGFSPNGSVTPMQNFAPQELKALADSQMQHGAAQITIGQHLQDNIDEAKAKAADTAFTMAAQDLLVGKDGNGFMNTSGQDSLKAYDTTWGGLKDARKAQEDALENDNQRRLFGLVADAHMSTFRGQMDAHTSKQVFEYNYNETVARGAQYEQMALAAYPSSTKEGSMYSTYKKSAVDSAVEAGKMKGIKEGSAQMDLLKQEATSRITAGIVSGLVADKKYIDAKKVLVDAWESKELSPRVYNALVDQVSQGATREAGILAGESIFEGMSATGTGADFGSAMKFVWAQEVPKGTDGFVANDGGKGVTRFGINSSANPDVNVGSLTADKAVDVYKKKYWDAAGVEKLPANIRLIYFDTSVNMGIGAAKDLYQKSGGDPGKFIELRRARYASLVKSNPGKYSAAVIRAWDNRMKSLASVALSDGKSDSLSSMIAMADGISDRDERDTAKARITEMYRERESAAEADHKKNYDAALDIASKRTGGWKDIPDSIWTKLKPEDQKRLREFDMGDDPDTLLYLDLHPEEWAPDRIFKYRNRLSNSSFRRYFDLGSGPGGEQNIAEASLDNDMLTATLDQYGLTNLHKAKEGTEDNKQYMLLRDKVKTYIDAEQRATGKKMSPDQKRAALTKMLQTVKVKVASDSWFTPSTTDTSGRSVKYNSRRMYEVQHKQNVIIPPKAHKRIVDEFKKRGIPFSDNMVLDAFLNMPDSQRYE